MDFQFDEFEYEDDVFYSELREQVLQLTAEDDDDDVQEQVYKIKNPNMAAQKEGLDDGSRRVYYDWPPHKEEVAAPTWIINSWRTGNGTGVFIPQIVQSKKKETRKEEERNRSNIQARGEKLMIRKYFFDSFIQGYVNKAKV